MGTYRTGRPKKYNPYTEAGHMPPHLPGEYRLRNQDAAIMYIGETNDLRRRMREHMRSGKLQSGYTIEFQVADGRSSSRTRRTHEQAKIAQHAPALNRSRGGEGRPAKRK